MYHSKEFDINCVSHSHFSPDSFLFIANLSFKCLNLRFRCRVSLSRSLSFSPSLSLSSSFSLSLSLSLPLDLSLPPPSLSLSLSLSLCFYAVGDSLFQHLFLHIALVLGRHSLCILTVCASFSQHLFISNRCLDGIINPLSSATHTKHILVRPDRR